MGWVEDDLFQSRHEMEHVYFVWGIKMIGCVNSILISYFTNIDAEQGV